MSELDRAIGAALAALDASPDGWLDPPDRRRLRTACGFWTRPYAAWSSGRRRFTLCCPV